MAKDFSSSRAALTARRLEGAQETGRDTTRTTDPTDQKDIPDHVAACWTKEKEELAQGVVSAAWGLTGHFSVKGKQFLCASLVLCILLSPLLVLFSFLFCPSKLSWSQPMGFSQSSSPSHCEGLSEGWVVFCCLLGWNTIIGFSPSYPHFIPLESWMPDVGWLTQLRLL